MDDMITLTIPVQSSGLLFLWFVVSFLPARGRRRRRRRSVWEEEEEEEEEERRRRRRRRRVWEEEGLQMSGIIEHVSPAQYTYK